VKHDIATFHGSLDGGRIKNVSGDRFNLTVPYIQGASVTHKRAHLSAFFKERACYSATDEPGCPCD